MRNAATIGSVWLSGNSYYPQMDKVIRIDTWGQLTEKERGRVRTLEAWKAEETLAAREYVRYTTRGRKGSDVFDRAAFEATRYATHADMITAYNSRCA